MKYLFILNDPPYGTERSYNALRLAASWSSAETGNEVKVFLIGDAAACAKAHQKVPQGYYNIGQMLAWSCARQAAIGVCGTCMDARGIADTDLIAGAPRGTMDELTDWTGWADKVIVF